MTNVEPKKKKNKKKKNSKKEEVVQEASSGDVLERVMDSIEMAGASLDFFESDEAVPAEDDNGSEEELSASDRIIDEEAGDADSEILEASDSDDVSEEGFEAMEAQDEASLEEASEEMEMASEDSLESLSEAGELEEGENLEMIASEENTEEFVDQTQALSVLESLLFSSDRPLGIGTFKQVFKGTNYKTKDIKKALEELQSVYAEASRGVTLEEINGGWQLRTKVDNMDFLRKLAKARPFKLSGPALETLAIIAYKQPIVKNEVDQIRGVESGHLVRALMEKHLVCFQGKSELPGKPMQYGTTRKFLEIFGLRNLRELPSLDEIDQLLPDGIGIEEEDAKLSDVTEAMSEDYQGNYSEGEEELLKIEGTLGDIDTSSEFFEQEKQRQKEKRDRDRARDIREALDVGEEVDPKDQRWLTRYDEKRALAQAEEEAKAELEAGVIAAAAGEELMTDTDQSDEALIPESESLDEALS
ncbi:MAG: SMC-Scp complex subunit ScpB, partial [Pseudomonadota bacterium]